MPRFAKVSSVAADRPRVNIDRLKPGRKRYKQGFNENHINQLMASFRADPDLAIAVPVIPIQDPSYDYELLGGHHTVEALRRLGQSEVFVDVKEGLSELEVARLSYQLDATNQPLNALEDTMGLVDNLIEAFRAAGAEVDLSYIKALFTAIRKKQSVDERSLAVVNQVWNDIKPRVSIASFSAARLPLLDLSNEFKAAIAEGLSPTSALEIAKVSDPQQRDALLKQAVSEEMSVADVKAAVKQVKPQKKTERPDYIVDYSQVGKKLKKLKWAELPQQKRQKIAGLLADLKKEIEGY